MRPRCSTFAAGFGFSVCGDCASCPPCEPIKRNNIEPRVIVRQSIACMPGIIYRLERRNGFRQESGNIGANSLAESRRDLSQLPDLHVSVAVSQWMLPFFLAKGQSRHEQAWAQIQTYHLHQCPSL